MIIYLIISGLSLSGCTLWPLKAIGGFAEHHQESLNTLKSNSPVGIEHGLRFDLEIVRQHLDILVLEGAELCFPATVIIARQRQNRISREMLGDLEFDAANDLIIQSKLLARLERQLDYVKKHNVCVLPVSNTQSTNQESKVIASKIISPGETGKRINELLNSDNQFAFNSSELNPKYVGRLAEAIYLLRKNPSYHLRITGHADEIGKNKHNQKLSLERAMMVSRYIQILGFPKNKIQLTAVGANNPLFKGTEPHNRLVNRRVTIDIVEKANTITRLQDKSL